MIGPSVSIRVSALSGLLLLVAYVSACSPNRAEEPTPVLSEQPKTAFPAPPLNNSESLVQMGWALPDGRQEKIANFSGKVLVLDFYATWCMPCRESIPHLVELEKRYSSQGLAVVGLNVGGPEDRDAIPAFAQEFNIQYSLAFPAEPLTDLLFADSDAIPQTFVFNRQSRLIKRYVGFESSMAEELDATIQAALSSQ